MTTNNKILTVSYGTFSCTLEGFDDNFGTMKVIAEYFRDLAADDRYFGAEPPQPDVEMLARIAEREISRRVDAREHDGKYVLSAEQAQVAPKGATPIATPVAPTSEPIDLQNAPVPQTADASDVKEDNVSYDADQSAAETESNANVVAEVIAAETTPEVLANDAVEIDDLVAENSDITFEAEEFFAQPAAEIAPEATEIEAEVVEATAPPEPDSIAAKLQRIRAVVSKSQDEAEDEDMFEDEYAEDLETGAPTTAIEVVVPVETPNSVVADAARDIEALQDAEDEVFEEDESSDDDITAILARFDAEANADRLDAATAPEDAAVEEDDELLLDTLAATVADNLDEDDTDTTNKNLFESSPAAELEEFESIEVEDEPVTDAVKPTALRARIIKVKRSEIDAAIASGALEELDDAGDQDDATSLSDEQEAELLADLAEVEEGLADIEATLADDDLDIPQEDAIFDGLDDLEETAAVATQPPVEDDDVSRLMAEVDNQMHEPEGTSRRSAFAHLKAAVMAKKADLGIGKEDEDKDGAYRSDLASVVKPRRPAARGSSARPEGARPAPLKLVAEQRVDIDTAPTGPVRPRRVAARDDAPMTDTGQGFEDYAAEMGAHDLPELLEAAASYLSFVEGREQFSRPQLMTKVRQVEKEDFSREDGLRSFGQLLRAGKIEKIKGGRFAVTGDIGYRPDHRAAS